jgi:opacity protein-like surface antigen
MKAGGQGRTFKVKEFLGMKTMTRWGLLASLAVLSAVSAFGADFSLSAGGGALAGGLFTRYSIEAKGAVDMTSTQKIDQFNYGGFLFFDATWAELSLGIQGGSNAWQEDREVIGVTTSTKGAGTETMLSLSLLGKYPVTLNERFTLFPLAGLEYQIALRERRDPETGASYDRTDRARETDSDGNAYALSAWNSLFVDIGAGLDFALDSSLFLRAELAYGFRLRTPYERDGQKAIEKMPGVSETKPKGLTSGPTLKIALGYRFF